MPLTLSCKHCGQKNLVPAKRLADSGRCSGCKNPLSPAHEPLSVDTAGFDDILHNARVPVLVNFWAEWCSRSRAAAPEVARTAADMAGQALVVKVDAQVCPDLLTRYDVRKTPNFVVLYGGRQVFQQAGPAGHRQMETWLKSAVSNAPR